MKHSSLSLIIVLLLGITSNINAQFAFNEKSQNQLATSNLSSLPLTFTENRGQWSDKTLFKTDAGGAAFYFCKDEVAYMFVRNTDELLEDSQLRRRQESHPDALLIDRPRYKKEVLLIKAQFIGTNPNPEMIGDDRLPHNNNYFYGNDPSKWLADVPNYSAIIYKDIYPRIDLKYYGNGKSMKYDFIVNPGADISQIQIRYEGADNLAITPNGDLEATTLFGPIHENIPSVYQEIGGGNREVTGRYIIRAPGVFGFDVENYNPSLTLVIDPELVYSTYLGGNDWEDGRDIAVDVSGSAYIGGYVYSADFPTLNPYQTHQGGCDAFVTKLSPEGSSLVYSTYLGGNEEDVAWGIAVDSSGCAYIAGRTYSTDFPTLNPYQTDQGGCDAFVTKLSPEGNSLVYSTYLGGDGEDRSFGITVDSSGCAYITGRTYSTDFPTINPYQTNQGGCDAFVTKLSSGGNSLFYSTYIGGNSEDVGDDIAIDSSGSAYITGYTNSSNFPTLYAYQTDQGSCDAFVTRLVSDGNDLVYSTYLGGDNWDQCRGIAVDGSGSAYVAGFTYSADFPTLNPYQTDQAERDAVVTKFSSSGTLVYSTYLGGNSNDVGNDIAVDDSGYAYITGWTVSGDFPTLNPYQVYQGDYDIIIVKLSSSGNALVYSTYLGGNNWDAGSRVTVDGNGCAYTTGGTISTDFPTFNPYDDSYNGGAYDLFVAKFEGINTGFDEIEQLPSIFELAQNYPNPFNNSTNIYYNLFQDSHVNIEVYDLLGRCVGSIVDKAQKAGYHQVIWNAGEVSSGIYFYRIQAGDYTETRKMLLMK
ncbi:MAG: T9SS type A sorting domain-containing protein [candidate division Zixibacteria bacterium]|nr:T9SS type A sorting domain-containing protein [candidate division Zixibacteria bacterium]